MSFDLDLGDVNSEKDLRGRVLPEPGIYHVVVGDVDLNPISKKGEAIDGIRVPFQVATGTVEGQRDREWDEIFGAPRATHKDGGQHARRRVTLLGLATEVISRDQLGSQVRPNWADMGGRHLIVEVFHEKQAGDNGREFVNCKIKGLNIWHVNDHAAANYPKDQELSELMPMSWRPEPASVSNSGSSAPSKATESSGGAAKAAATTKAAAPKPGARKPAAAAANGGAAAPAPTANGNAAAAAPVEVSQEVYDDLLT